MTPRKKILVIFQKQRSFRLAVKPNGTVVLTCPLRASKLQIQEFLKEHATWLEQSLHKIQNRLAQLSPHSFSEGERVLLLGERYQIVEKNVGSVELSEPKLLIIPKGLSYTERQKAVFYFYKKTSQQMIRQRVSVLSQEMKLYPRAVKFRNNKTLWGSCQPDNTLVFNWKLICAPTSVVDYVVVHEIAHIIIKNHSVRFWDLVKMHCLNYKQCQLWLRKNHFVFDFLNDESEFFTSKLDINAKQKTLLIEM